MFFEVEYDTECYIRQTHASNKLTLLCFDYLSPWHNILLYFIMCSDGTFINNVVCSCSCAYNYVQGIVRMMC